MPARFPILSLLLFLAVSPAGAVRFDLNPPAVTAGAATVTVDVSRTNEPGDVGGFSDDEMDTFEWFAPNAPLPNGMPVRLPRATLVRDDLVRLQIDAARLLVPGIATIAYTADPAGRRQRQVIAFFVNRPPQIEGGLTGGAVNTRMAQTVEALYGTGPYRWSLSSGSLPPGVALVGRAQFADFTGVATSAGSYTFSLRVVDGFGISAEKQFTLVIAGPPGPALRIATATLPSGAVGVPYRLPLQATGGATPYQWSTTGSLPPGVSLDPGGILTGTPTSAGSYNIAVRVQDASGGSDQKTLALVIDAVGQFTSVQAASFETGVSAQEAIVSGYGENLGAALVSAPAGNPAESLSGVSVVVRDVSGRESAAPLFSVSPRQINYVVPRGMRVGPAVVTVRSGGRTIAAGDLRIETIAPGIFTANADGKGVAAGGYIRVAPGQAQTTGSLFRCDAAPGSCRPEPIDLGSAPDSVYLQFFATGVRQRARSRP